MKLWASLAKWLEPSETRFDQTFSLGDRGDQPPVEQTGPGRLNRAQMMAENTVRQIDTLLEAVPQGKSAVEKAGDLTRSLNENVERVKRFFRMPPNKDLIVREFTVGTDPVTPAAGFYMEGLSDKRIQNEHILDPLMRPSGGEPFSLDLVQRRLLPGSQVSEIYTLAEIGQSVLAGDSVLLFQGQRAALAVETKGFPTRSVSEPKVEQVVWGPHDAFNEAWRVNVALVRRRLKDPRVVTEILTVGELGHTYVGMMYVDTVTSPKLVAEVKRRVESLKLDVLWGAGGLEQLIEDSPGSLLPGNIVTERPDRAAAYLSEGHVALFVDNSPRAIILPGTLWSLLQTAEDYYLRFPFGSLLRILRLIAILVALVVPAIYIAIINYHPEMIPTELMLFIAASREAVPLPAVVELILMDVGFELIREAGIRIPNAIGPTIGLVSSLILGQAAVQAKIVSPVMIIVVAATGLASFVIPNYLAGFGIRTLRFAMVGSAAALGFFGIGAAAFLLLIYVAGLRSFGVPYLSPVAPMKGRVMDILTRPRSWQMELRPQHLRPVNRRRQPPVVRQWDPFRPHEASPDEGPGGRGGGS